MEMKLHANATTTPRIRAHIQSSDAPASVLARELGVSETTIRRWRGRSETTDRSHTPHRLQVSLSPVEERLAVELRETVGLSIDDALEVMRRCVKPDLSRSALHRCWRRHGVSARPKKARETPAPFQTDQPAGFIHVDVKYLTSLGGRRDYAYVAIDRATRFVYVEVLPDRKGGTAAGFLRRFLEAFAYPVHTVLTDNGSEFTDRFAVDKKGKPDDQPSGGHPFDKVCAAHGIRHKLARPFRPQTNGMVERFNRRLQEHLESAPKNGKNRGKNCFDSHEQRTRYIQNFVQNYNRTRLRCLGYKSPTEALTNLTEHNTKAGVQKQYGMMRNFRLRCLPASPPCPVPWVPARRPG
ncbi:MAG: IS481 family transposase [Alphaproteobacteria bacterium]